MLVKANGIGQSAQVLSSVHMVQADLNHRAWRGKARSGCRLRLFPVELQRGMAANDN
jgi:hypothetical protein